MFGLLLKVSLKNLYRSVFGRTVKSSANRKPIIKVLIALFAVYVIGALLLTVGMIFDLMSGLLAVPGLEWLYFAMLGILSFALCFIGSVFAIQSQVFDAKDNEFLLSMPIPPRYILSSRLAVLVIMNLAYTLLIAIPAEVIYCITSGISVLQIVFWLIAILLIPFLSLAISSIVGWVIGLVVSKSRFKSLINTVLSLAFFFGYMYVYLNLQKFAATLMENGTAIGDAIRRTLPPFYHFGNASGTLDTFSLLLLALWCIIPFALMCIVLSKSFIKITTANKGQIRYKSVDIKRTKASKPRMALLKKELRRFFSLPMYILNSGIGSLFMLIFAGALLLKGQSIVSSLISQFYMQGSDISPYITPLVCILICFCCLMINTTAPSISLEGGRLWILRAHPVNVSDIFFAKIGVNLIISIPSIIIVSVVSWLVLDLSTIQFLFVLIISLLVQVFAAMFGLTANILMPKMNWISEVVVIKQSASVMTAIFGLMAIVALPVLVYIIALSKVFSIDAYMLLSAAYFAVLIIADGIYLSTGGKKRFEKI